MKTKEDRYLEAKNRVKELKDFYSHLATYVLVNIFLAGLNYYTNQWAYPWFLWVTGGWGIGLVFDALKTYRINPLFNKDWEDRKIKEYMNEKEHKRWE